MSAKDFYLYTNLNCHHPRNAVYDELMEAQAERQNGYQGRNARDVLADMERVIGEAEAVG